MHARRSMRPACPVHAGQPAGALALLSVVSCLLVTVAYGEQRAWARAESRPTAAQRGSAAGLVQRKPRASGRLRWAPPRLVRPITIRLTSPTRELNLSAGRDYVIRMPRFPIRPGPSGGLWISGGRNVVLVGGELDFGSVTDPDEKSGRVAAIFNNTGTVHIEGLYAHGAGIVEGIQNYSANSIVQVENCRFEHLRGSEAGHHSDLFQFPVGITGVVHRGRPPGGDFVPRRRPNVAYVSPGYRTRG